MQLRSRKQDKQPTPEKPASPTDDAIEKKTKDDKANRLVLVKFALVFCLVIVLPLATYYALTEYLKYSSTTSGIYAIVVAQCLLIGYVLLGLYEED